MFACECVHEKTEKLSQKMTTIMNIYHLCNRERHRHDGNKLSSFLMIKHANQIKMFFEIYNAHTYLIYAHT